MSGVNPPADGGYNYYRQTLSELEDQLKQEADRSRQREKQNAEELEASYEANLKRRDEELDRTVKEIKKNANDSIEANRKYSDAEVQRIRDQTYDRFGRSHGLEADVLRQQLRDYTEATGNQIKRDQADMKDLRDSTSSRIAESNERHARDLEKAVDSARTSASQTYDELMARQRGEYNEFKTEAEKSYGELQRERMEQQNSDRRRYENALSEAQRDFDRRMERTNRTDETRALSVERARQAKQEDETRALNESHARESGELRGQIKDLIHAQGDYSRGKSEGQADAVKEYEDQYRQQTRLLQEANDRTVAKLKREVKDTDRHYSQLNNQNLKDRDSYFAEVIRGQNLDHHNTKTELQRTFMDDRQQLDLRNQRDREQAQKSMERQGHEMAAARNAALEKQAGNYQEVLERQRANDGQKIKALEKELHRATTSQDVNVISPAAEAAVRNVALAEHQKTMNEELKRNRRSEDSIQQSYAKRLSDVVEDTSADKTNIIAQRTAEDHQNRMAYLDSLRDSEFRAKEAARSQNLDHDRETEHLTRVYSNMLERQRREQNVVFTQSRNDASAKTANLRQEHDFEKKMAMRSFSARQNELIREYEKKLADQEVEHRNQIDDVKQQMQLALREAERRSRQTLEEQQRAADQRVAQIEYQHKDRERLVAQNYQDELDKVKRSNALLIKKKS
jgi:hypothetical protein